jgi:hypothetical protein
MAPHPSPVSGPGSNGAPGLSPYRSEVAQEFAVSPTPAEHLRNAACPPFSTAAVQAYVALLQDHESASLFRKPLLTQAGLLYLRRRLLPAAFCRAEQNGTTSAASPNGDLLPYWDAANRRLWLGTHLVKEFRQPAPHQTALLDVFHEEGWASGRIDDPLPRAQDEGEKEAKRRLHETIKNLNRGLEPGTIRFRGDGTGQGIVWEYDRRRLLGRRGKRKVASMRRGRPHSLPQR